MAVLTWGMVWAGVAALVAGLVLVRGRFAAAAGSGKLVVLGPVLDAMALAMFAAEHFLDARDLMAIVPKWLPGHLFWTYFVGVALLAAAVSFLAWRYVRWSGSLLALLFLIIVVTLDLPGVPKNYHDRIFWTLTVRETMFAAGAMVLAGSAWRRGAAAGQALMGVGRTIVGLVCVFYGVEHFFFPRNVVGVPLEKMTPAYIPAPVVIAYFIGAVLVVCGVGMLVARWRQSAAAFAGTVLALVVIFFYGPILIAQMGTPGALEGANYFGDTLLFAGTVLLAGFSTELMERVGAPRD
ncbi:MAG: hypothetical protein WBY53_02600 [Acidobacteriaceae bacterium]